MNHLLKQAHKLLTVIALGQSFYWILPFTITQEKSLSVEQTDFFSCLQLTSQSALGMLSGFLLISDMQLLLLN